MNTFHTRTATRLGQIAGFCPSGDVYAAMFAVSEYLGHSVEQDWANEATRITFEDGSVLVFSGPCVSAFATGTDAAKVEWFLRQEDTMEHEQTVQVTTYQFAYGRVGITGPWTVDLCAPCEALVDSGLLDVGVLGPVSHGQHAGECGNCGPADRVQATADMREYCRKIREV